MGYFILETSQQGPGSSTKVAQLEVSRKYPLQLMYDDGVESFEIRGPREMVKQIGAIFVCFCLVEPCIGLLNKILGIS